MGRRLLTIVALAVMVSGALLLCGAAPSFAQVGIPALTKRVTDTSGTLSPSEVLMLESKLAQLETSKGSQVAVLLVITTQPESIEQYALRVVEKWKLGRARVDDGALILLAMQDRAVRIEVGYGLEGALSDAVVSRIIRDIMTPELRAGRPYKAVDAAVDAVAKVISGEPLPAPTGRSSQGISGDLFGLLIVPLFFVDLLRALFGRTGGAVVAFFGGALVGAIAGMWLPGLVAGLVAALIVALGSSVRRSRRGYYGGSYGGSSSSWGSGGGFRGGGGSFGGGGASGRW